MKKKEKKRKIKYQCFVAIFFLLVSFIVVGIAQIHKTVRNSKNMEISALERLDADDKKIAAVYAQLYSVEEERVAQIKENTGDWESVYQKLKAEYFSIGETVKYQMVEEGYSMEDLNKSESLARETGRRAIDLAKAKGKANEGKEWTDVIGANEGSVGN